MRSRSLNHGDKYILCETEFAVRIEHRNFGLLIHGKRGSCMPNNNGD